MVAFAEMIAQRLSLTSDIGAVYPQIRAVWSVDPDAMNRRSGERERPLTASVWPERVTGFDPSMTFQILIVMSAPADTTREPSPEKAIAYTSAACPVSVRIEVPSEMRQRRTVRSSLPVASS